MEYFTWVQKHDEERDQWEMVAKSVEGQVSPSSFADLTTPGGAHKDEKGEKVEEVGGPVDGEDGEVIEVDGAVKSNGNGLKKKEKEPEKDPESEEDWVRLLLNVQRYAEEHHAT